MLTIIDETSEFVICNKPPGIAIGAEPRHRHQNPNVPSLLQTIREQLDDPQLLPVHRLDKVTSGVIIIGKGTAATAKLSMIFQKRQVSKYYLAILQKKPKKKQGTIKGDLIKSRDGGWRLSQTKSNPSETQFFSYGIGDGRRLAIVKPLTGKTHQIRVAMKAIGAPILGDQQYGGVEADRVYLHAWQLIFTLNNMRYHYRCDPDCGRVFGEPTIQLLIQSHAAPDSLNWPCKNSEEASDHNR